MASICVTLAGTLRNFLFWATAVSTVALFVPAVWRYVENGLLYPCPEKHDTLLDPWQHHHYLTTPLLRVCITMVGALVVEFYSVSDDLQLVSWFNIVLWNYQTGTAYSIFPQCYGVEPGINEKAWAPQKVAVLWSCMGFACMLLMWIRVTYERWRRLDIEAGGSLSGAMRCTATGASLSLPPLVLVIFIERISTSAFSYTSIGTLLYPAFFGCCIVRLTWPSVHCLIDARRVAASRAPPARGQRIRQAASSVSLQFVGNLAVVASKALFVFLQLLVMSLTPKAKVEEKLLQRSFDVVSVADQCCMVFLMLSLAGLFSGAGTSARLKRRTARERQGRWRRNWESWQRRGAEHAEHEEGAAAAATPPDPTSLQLQLQWDEKVRELAGRGVSLDALLQFYRQTLPGLMPHFDPQRHTTGNIVFEAVIPFTSSQGCAAADLMMAGEYVLPQKMVTHNWSNKFSDLLAAIVSDAIGESDFGMVAWLLVQDPDRLEAWIADRQVGSRTYWVCAFAVNQHVSICGARKACRCGRQKFLNNSPPLMPDGSSIPCEVNKFDTMMKYLSAENPAFEQVVAVDAKCDLFWRAWCISEIATAHETGMPQSLKVTSPDCLQANMEKLGQLKIEDMEASRKEDKELILSHIENHENFNKTLRHVLLNEVIPAWSSLDALEQMSLAGCIIRWQRISQQTGDLAIWAA